MTKKDYEHIANILHAAGTILETVVEKQTFAYIVRKLANELDYNYPRFDKTKFFETVYHTNNVCDAKKI